ncbi:MAG: glycosyltransferase family 4 protein [Rikenellaceae bacterium]
MEGNRTKIFISAYACEPNLGSEIGVGWHWVMEMSKYFDLWVLTRESNRESIEGWLAENELENTPTFLYYDLPKKWRWWKKGLRGVRLYYMLWQRLSDEIVEHTMQQNSIIIYHHLTYGNALWSVSSYGQKQTFIWGPTSVGNSIEREFTKHYGFKSRLKEWAQRLVSSTLYFNAGFQKRCRNATLILCKTEQTLASIPSEYRDKAVLFTDVAVELIDTEQWQSNDKRNGVVRYLSVGRLEGWRGFDLLIEAMARVTKESDKIHLDILGEGADMKHLEQLIKRHNLQDYITLAGQVSRDEYYQYMAECDVVVNPSLREGAVTTAFDSMSFAKPIICIDSGGYSRYFRDDYAIVLPREGREEIIDRLAEAIVRLSDAKNREELSKGIILRRDTLSWSHKAEEIRDIIKQRLCIE